MKKHPLKISESEVIRYPKKEIDLSIFESFYKECGEYPGVKKMNSEISSLWSQIFDEFDINIFQVLQNKDLNKLKELYEDYYINGISHGASSGKVKTLENEKKLIKKSHRNINRVEFLGNHFGYGESEPNKVYELLYKKYKIPDAINDGQTWGWQYGDNFVHFEIADYIYFLDILIKILDEYGLDKTMFVGEGSGLLSSLLYNNYDIKESHQIDFGHFLLKQYLTNYDSGVNVKYHYAENFQTDFKHNSQILINQDSFPEMTIESMEKYIENAKLNNVNLILSYNTAAIRPDGRHINFYKVLKASGYQNIWEIESTIRPQYFIELFQL